MKTRKRRALMFLPLFALLGGMAISVTPSSSFTEKIISINTESKRANEPIAVQTLLDAGIMVVNGTSILTALDTIDFSLSLQFIGQVSNSGSRAIFPGFLGNDTTWINPNLTFNNIVLSDSNLNLSMVRGLFLHNSELTINQNVLRQNVDGTGTLRSSLVSLAAQANSEIFINNNAYVEGLATIEPSNLQNLKSLLDLQRTAPTRIATININGSNLRLGEVEQFLSRPEYAAYTGITTVTNPVGSKSEFITEMDHLMLGDYDRFKSVRTSLVTPYTVDEKKREPFLTPFAFGVTVASNGTAKTDPSKTNKDYVSWADEKTILVLTGSDKNSTDYTETHFYPYLTGTIKIADNAVIAFSVASNWFEINTETFEFKTGTAAGVATSLQDFSVQTYVPNLSIPRLPGLFDVTYGIRGVIRNDTYVIEKYDLMSGEGLEELSPINVAPYNETMSIIPTESGRLLVSKNIDNSYTPSTTLSSIEQEDDIYVSDNGVLKLAKSTIVNLVDGNNGYETEDGKIYVTQTDDIFTPNGDGTYSTGESPSRKVIITDSPSIIYPNLDGNYEDENNKYYPSDFDNGLIIQSKDSGEVTLPDGTKITGTTPIITPNDNGGVNITIPTDGTITYPNGNEFDVEGTYESQNKSVVLIPGDFITLDNSDKIGLPTGGTIDGNGDITPLGDKIHVPANKTDDLIVIETGVYIVPIGTIITKNDGTKVNVTSESIYENGVLTVVYDLNVFTGGNGVFTSSLANGKQKEGSNLTLTATADPDYSFAGWYVDGVLISEDETYTTILSSNIRLEARFVSNATLTPLPPSENSGNTAIVAISVISCIVLITTIVLIAYVTIKSKKVQEQE